MVSDTSLRTISRDVIIFSYTSLLLFWIHQHFLSERHMMDRIFCCPSSAWSFRRIISLNAILELLTVLVTPSRHHSSSVGRAGIRRRTWKNSGACMRARRIVVAGRNVPTRRATLNMARRVATIGRNVPTRRTSLTRPRSGRDMCITTCFSTC